MTWELGAVRVAGAKLAYQRTGGTRPVLILLHGITDDGLCWTRVARDLEDEFDIVMPDARGHGASSRLAGPLTVDLLADDVAALTDVLGIGGALVVGHSMGAITALALGASRPDLVRGVVLEDPPFDVPPRPTVPDEVIAAEAASWASLSEAERHARATAQHATWHRLETDAWADAKVRVDPSVAQQLGMFVGYDWRAACGRLRCSGLLVTGDPGLGAIVTPELAEEAVARWPPGRVVHVAGAGHSIHRDRWDAAMPPIRAFLRDPAGTPT